jgi:hypothetical protein
MRVANKELIGTIIGWFDGAKTKRHPQRPNEDDKSLLEFAALVDQLKLWRDCMRDAEVPLAKRRADPTLKSDLAELHRIGEILQELYERLPNLIKISRCRNFPRVVPFATGNDLNQLLVAVKTTMRERPYIAPRARRLHWHTCALAMRGSIEAVLKSIGWTQRTFSAKADGPIVTVLCSALKFVDGEYHSPDAVEKFLKRFRAKRGMSRSLLNIEKRSLPKLILSGVGLANKDAV